MRASWITAFGIFAISVAQSELVRPDTFKRHTYLVPEMCTPAVRRLAFNDHVMVTSQLRANTFYKTNVSCTLNFTTLSSELLMIVTFAYVDTVDCHDYLNIIPEKSHATKYCGRLLGKDALEATRLFRNQSLQVEWKVPEHRELQRQGQGFRVVLTAALDGCGPNEICFMCNNGLYIHQNGVCNGLNNCGDMSDEVDCRRPPEPTPAPTPSTTCMWMIVLCCAALLLALSLIFYVILLRKENEELQALLNKGKLRGKN